MITIITPIMVIIIVTQLCNTRYDTYSHWLHLCGFSPKCVFKASSSWVHEWMQNSKITMITFVCLFPATRVQMCPQSTWIKAKIVTLTAFVWLFSTMQSCDPCRRPVPSQPSSIPFSTLQTSMATRVISLSASTSTIACKRPEEQVLQPSPLTKIISPVD